ncbi:guanylate-binding protein 6-like isoform X2 [Moschus berezovskii]|uniref:guanylate-binding protein 6-like isoform X2 n=1 Tax=Moschus berezovskii TaxID=68408 RepID=UPI0024450A54|nr:guanylate-binding protein 6-like isoform X2 [Moschus berezovskii]
MASGSTIMDPICLVRNQNNQLTVNPRALKILEQISQPVVVVAIAGLYRTGKSYLMNRLAGQNHGFRLGSTVRSETKGIWMWCVPHPSKENHTLVLLDTEGLGDVEKGNSKNDSWIFALAVLLSSTFIYNSMSTINHQALEQLHYVTELTELIRTKSSPSSDGEEDSAKFVSFFPDFIWTVRDFMLELELDEYPITEDEYLENALKLIPGKDPQIQNSNMPRECIRKFFPKRKCFVFDRPTNDRKLLLRIEELSDKQLDVNFRKQSKDFCSYIFTHAKPKTLREGITVNGGGLGTLVEAYVDAINSGGVPCLENAVITLAERENSAAVQKAADHYSEQMTQRLNLPTDTLQELLEVHAACEKEAIAIFMERSFKDDKLMFQKQLVANQVLQSFLQSQGGVEEAILQADQALTDGDKAMAAECAKKEAAEREQELLREKQNEEEQKMEAQERSFIENLAQLQEKTDSERENLLREQEMMLEHKLKMQKELLTEGFKKDAEEVNKDIDQLKQCIEATEKSFNISDVLDMASVTLIAVLPGAYKVVGVGLKFLSDRMKEAEKP